MRIIAMLLLISASVTAFSQSTDSEQTEHANQQFKLVISADASGHSFEQVVKNSSSITIRIRKTNITNHEINKRNEPEIIYDIRDSDGNKPEPNKGYHYQGHNVAMLIGTKDMVLQPGEIREDDADIGSWVDMSKPGTYTIQVSEHVSDDPNSDVVKSNIIKITVLAPDPPAENN
jgi:hypothetical protein